MPGAEMESRALSHPQMQIWVGQRLHPHSPLYNMAFRFVFPAKLEVDLFQEAWRRVAAGSAVLRGRIVEEGGAPRMRPSSEAPATEVLRPGSDFNFQAFCDQRAARPLPLDGPLVDSVLVLLPEGRTGWYLNLHHLISDAFSTRLLYQQVAAHYAALLDDASEKPPELPGYASAIGGLPQGSPGARQAAERHWDSRRRGASQPLPLYGLRGEPQGTASVRHTLLLDKERTAALDRLAAAPGLVSLSPDLSRLALFAALLSAWLQRASSHRELGFDAPVAGRPTAEAKRALGLFIEVFPFTARVEAGDSLRTLGARCLAEAKLFLRHALPGTSAPSGAGARPVVLNYVPGEFGPFAGLRPEIDWVHPGHGDSVHALRLQVHDFAGAGRTVLHFDFNQAALPDLLKERAMRHFETLLAAALDDPDRPLATIDLRTPEERAAAAALNDTASEPLPRESVVERIAARVDSQPDAVALRQPAAEIELTYAQLWSQAGAVAESLIRDGVAPGERVAIFARRSVEAVVAILGTLRARAAYVPVDPALPWVRREHLLRDSGARRVLLGPEDGPPDLPDGSVSRWVSEILAEPQALPLPLCPPALDDLAYLIYTSGSSGPPKGVLIEHGGLADYLEWAQRRYVRGEGFTFALFTSLSVDLTVTSLFLPLISGGVLEIYPEAQGSVDTALMDVVAAGSADFVKLTPSHLGLLLRLDLGKSPIRRLIVGGESFETRLAAAAQEHLGAAVEIHNEYGPTEAVVGCVAHRFDAATDLGLHVPIGAPADHVQVEILDEAGTPVPEGVPGELWIARHGLARGYHRQPGLTAERFQVRPGRPGERWYRSGDRVRTADAGQLEYLGRLDRQVKVSGFRVEPGEIEAALRESSGVEQVVVLARRRPTTGIAAGAEARECARCGLPSSFPRAEIDDASICRVCRSYEAVREHAQAYFKTLDDLRTLFAESAQRSGGAYDCMMLYSGGKDSTYALCRLVEMELSVYAFTLDNGFISEGAKGNIRRVTEQLGVPVEFATTPAMNAIFRDSLMRFSNVCNGCFKTIYTLSTQRARELKIPVVVTGLSRGQMFETRLTEELFRHGRRSVEEIDAAVLAARKLYHRTPDEVSRSLDVGLFQDDRIFEEVEFVDFYRYCDAPLDEMLDYLRREVPWVRPEDTGRSTNCLINDAGIYVHKRERGFHNYALPYSWDVRLGHKTLEAARDELDDEIDEGEVRSILAEVDYDPDRAAGVGEPVSLEAFYLAAQEIDEAALRRHLEERLPAPLIPSRFHRVEEIPLAASGKVDEAALLRQGGEAQALAAYRAADGPVEEFLVEVWEEELRQEQVGADDHFFRRGGTSLTAIQVMLRLCREFDLDLPLDAMFTRPTLSELARLAEDRILADVEAMSDDDRQRLEDAGESPA